MGYVGGALKDILEYAIVVAVQASRERRPTAPPRTPVEQLVVGARASDHGESGIGPQVALRAEAPWRTDGCQQQRDTHGPEVGDRLEHPEGRITFRFGHHGRFGLLALSPKHIELSVQGLGTEPSTLLR